MKENKFECDLTLDLLPPYLEGATGEESDRFLSNHLKACTVCRETFEMMRGEMPGECAKKHNSKRRRRRLSVTVKLAVFLLCYLLFVLLVLFMVTLIFAYGF